MKDDRITFLVDKEFKKKLQVKCIKKEVTLTDIATMLLTDWLNEGR